MEPEEPHVLLYFDVNKVPRRASADLILCAMAMSRCVGHRLMLMPACGLCIRP